MILCVLTLDDWPLWRAVRLAALTEAPRAFTVGLADWDRGGAEQWRARLSLPGAHNVVALLDGEPAGMARGVPGENGYELRSVWVSPAARGHGVGDLLLTEIEDWADSAGAPALRLAVFRDNEPAIALYERHGFVAVGDAADQLVMAKPLR